MKLLYLILVAVHALIHILGFLKAFDIKDIKELTLPISKPIGVLWLLALILFIGYAVLNSINYKYSWLVGFIAVIISQSLIFYSWQDAKFGTIPNVAILIVTFAGLGMHLMRNEFQSIVEGDFTTNNNLSTEIITEADIAGLPLPVKKYLRYTKSIGQPKVKNFMAEFTGGMRSKPGDDYMPLNTVQYNFYNQPSRYFYMQATKMGLPAIGLHFYKNSTATFRVKLFGWISMVDAKGDKMNQAETVTLLNDMCAIAPPTLIDKRLEWKEINDTTTSVTFTNGSIKVSATLFFSTEGALVNFISNDRYNTDGKTYENYPWATPLENYKMLGGYFLPSKAKLIYQQPQGDFTYGELEYKNLKFNLEAIEK